MPNKKKVVILGGGVGAMTAAYQLTRFDDWQNRFDITIYQMGWRLGGKGASGRNLAAGNRIEEHGLHVWAGFYDNAIKLMKDCYTQANDAGIDGLFASFDDAFKPFNKVVLGEHVDGQWIPWAGEPPMNDAVPGEGGVMLSPWDYFGMAVDLLKELFEKHAAKAGLLPVGGLDLLPRSFESLVAELLPSPAKQHTLLHHLHELLHGPFALPMRQGGPHLELVGAILEVLGGQLQQAYKTDLSGKDNLRRFINQADLTVAALKGVIMDRVLFEGFDAINEYEISAWLKRHGAHAASLQSASARAIYDYAFGFSKGVTDYQHRAIAAGTSLNGLCRLAFTYKGAFFFEMCAGMGDTVFTPFYKLLKQQGVKFEFFHKVMGIEADAQSGKITRIKMQRQVDLNGSEYQPLVRVHNLDCWPSEPDYSQIQQGAQLQSQGINLESSWADWDGVHDFPLEEGTDFDAVILGISVGALGELCGDLADKDPRWEDMLREVKTARTLALQLWLKKSSAELGWQFGESILTGYEDAFNTWADLSHLLEEEAWPAGAQCKSVAYFCGPMDDDPQEKPFSDHGYPATQLAQVKAEAKAWIEQHAGWMWPQIVKSDGSIDWDQLCSVNNVSGEALLDEQFFRANIDPTERYVLAVPGSPKYRIRSDQSGFKNLFLAGDWTYNGMNAGCVEAAAMSGMRAAAGLAEESIDIVGEAFTHASYETPNQWNPVDLTSFRAQNQAWPGSGLFGMAQTSGANAIMAMPAADVAATLPRGLELAPQSLTGPGQHPVVLLFGWQEEVRPNILPGGMDYHEFIITVPYVQHSDAQKRAQVPGPFIYMPRLYLDKALPTWLGVYGYGYEKERACIQVDKNSYEVSNAKTNAPIIATSYAAAGPTGSEMDFPNFRLASETYALPLISKHWLGWRYSYFDFALGQALIQPINMEVKIYNDQAAGLPQGFYQVPPIQANGLGAFFFSTRSTITNPLQSRHMRKLIKEKHDQPDPQLLP